MIYFPLCVVKISLAMLMYYLRAISFCFNKWPFILRQSGLVLFLLALSTQIALANTEQSYRTIAWYDLMPEADIKKLESMPEVNHESDEIVSLSEFTQVRPELNGEKIKVPGYIVPLEYTDKQTTTEFFLVPYFGACIHVPPPPPNQIIYVSYPKGINIDQLHHPFWLSGTLSTQPKKNELAESSYSMTVSKIELYQ